MTAILLFIYAFRQFVTPTGRVNHVLLAEGRLSTWPPHLHRKLLVRHPCPIFFSDLQPKMCAKSARNRPTQPAPFRAPLDQIREFIINIYGSPYGVCYLRQIYSATHFVAFRNRRRRQTSFALTSMFYTCLSSNTPSACTYAPVCLPSCLLP